MFDSLVQTIADYPYLGVALVFLLCGIGFPLPEELVLIAGGYVCAKFPEKASLHWMMLWCGGAILTFDLVPFVLGRTFGARVLRIRWLRLVVTRRRLADFDRWFRRRGDLVIFFARFLAGIRVIAFFTAGVMRMRWRRFLLLDGLGIVIIVPLMVWLGHRGAGVIDDVIARVQAVERGLLWSAIAGVLVLAMWLLWRRRQRRLARPVPAETFVEPRLPVTDEAQVPEGTPAAGTPDESEGDDDPTGSEAEGDEPGADPRSAESGLDAEPVDGDDPDDPRGHADAPYVAPERPGRDATG
ncbi:MAG: DedA family protein [Planctomycetota bacterium]